jgi:hypothetical protein
VGIETLGAISLASSAGSGILGAFGASNKADAESATYAYKAQVARNNAIIAERNAAQATEAGGASAQVQDLKTKNLVGQQLVTQAANGLDVGSGTNVNLRESAAALGHLDTLTILHNAAKSAAGYKAQASNFTAEAELSDAASENAKTAGGFAIASSLLGGATSVSDKWASFKSKGVF